MMRTRIAWRAVGILAALVQVVPLPAASGIAGAPAPENTGAVTVVDLSVNSRGGGQVGVGDSKPTLAWRMTSPVVEGNPCFDPSASGECALDRQTAYEVEAATTPHNLQAGKLIWETGKVASSQQSVEFGRTLASRDSVAWRARVWDANGDVSQWSATSTFTVGLLKQSDWAAKWIEDPEYTYQTNGVPNPLPVFAKQFDIGPQVASATLYATGLGQYAATLNGKPVGKAVLEPGQTGYWDEVNYRTYDVSDLVERGSNVLGMEVGSGVLQQADTTSIGRYIFQPGNNEVLGTPKVRAQLEVEFTNGSMLTIATEESWLARSGPTVFSSWWGGEDYDARVMKTGWTQSSNGLSGPKWHNASVANLDETTIPRDITPLVADPRPPVTVAEEAHPVSITEQQPSAANTTVVAPATAGDTNVTVASITGIFSGDAIELDGRRYTVTEVGIGAKAPTTLTAPTAVGDTTISVANVGAACLPGAACEGTANFVVGQTVAVGTGSSSDSVTVTGVTRNGTGNNAPGTVTVTPGLRSAHNQGDAVRGAGTGISFTPALAAAVPQGAPVTSDPQPAYVLDFGRNLVGLLKITGKAPAGTTVTLLGSEAPTPPTNYNTVSQSGIYRYTFAGRGQETWHAQFTYNGQRYVVVRGLPSKPTTDTVTLLVTHASNEETSTFESCDPMLESIYGITKRALQGNMQSVLTDCPNREKGPYTGDNLHNIDAELTMYDMLSYQGQLVANMRTSQRPNAVSEGYGGRYAGKYEGMIANIAPEYHAVPDGIFNGRWFLDEPNWGGAVIRIPWALYQIYGDTSAMEANYQAMVKWLDYVGRSKATNASGEINGLGDWSAAQATTPAEAIIDIGYYEGAHVLSLIADKLGKTADAQKYRELAADLKEEYNADYLHVDPDTGRAWYANDTEASNAVALDSGLVPDEYRDEVFESLVGAVEDFNYRLSHGSVAGGAVFRTLHAGGRDDLLYRMIINPQAPSYAFQVNRGQTTLSENLSGGGSQNHHFLGEVADWLVHDLVGIDQQADSTAYQKLLIRPAVGAGIDDIPCVEGSYTTPAGVASNRIVRSADRLEMTVTVLAQLSARARAIRQGARHPVLLLDAGDVEEGSVRLSALSKGVAGWRMLGAAGVDAAVVGNGGLLRYGTGVLPDYAAGLGSEPLICDVDLDGRPPRGTTRSRLIPAGDLTVGVIGATDYYPQYDVFALSERGRVTAVRVEAQWLRRQGADVVVLLSHCGLNADRSVSWALRGKVDLIVGGHSHDVLDEGDRTQGIPIVQAGCFGERLGRVTIEVTANGVDVVDVRHEVVGDEWPADQRVLDELASCERDLQVWLDEPVAGLPEAVGWQELYDSAVARLLARALLSAYPGDVGMAIAGHCTAGLPEGTVTRGDLWAATSSPGNAATATMTGAALRSMVAKGTSESYATTVPRTFRGRPYGALHLAGAELRAGELLVGAVPVTDDRRYRVTGSDLELSTYGLLVDIEPEDLIIHAPAILPELLEEQLRRQHPMGRSA